LSNLYKNIDVTKFRNEPVFLLEKFNLLKIPVDLTELAKFLKIDQVNYKNCENNLNGKIEYKAQEKEVSIYINEDEPKTRQRFTFAHEIAHFIYDIDFQTDKDMLREDAKTLFRKNMFNPIERRADKFAEQLLMPKELFEIEVFKVKDKLFPTLGTDLGVYKIYQISSELSNLFEVSKPAVFFRLHSIGIIKESMRKELFEYHK